MSQSKISAIRIAAAERAAKILELRRQGHTCQEIGTVLGCSGQRAWKILHREMGRVCKKRAEHAEHLRQLEALRLDKILAAIQPKAEAGDLEAIDRCLKIQARRARLEGLDLEPQQTAAGKAPPAINITIAENVVHGGPEQLEKPPQALLPAPAAPEPTSEEGGEP